MGATEWTASVHTLHMPKPNVTRVQSATPWTASVHTLHTPNVQTMLRHVVISFGHSCLHSLSFMIRV